MTDRPPRKHIPMAVKRAVFTRQGGICLCGCKTPIWMEIVVNGKKKLKCNVIWDHSPAIRIRDISDDGLDYVPHQLDPNYLVARCPESNRRKTTGNGATTAGADAGLIKKERHREKRAAGMSRKSSKWGSRSFPKRKSIWAKRPMQKRKLRT